MKTVFIFLGILLSVLLFSNYCYATEANVAEFQPSQGADVTQSGEEKFKFLPHHKPFFKKPFFKPIPPKYPILEKPIPKFPVKEPLAKPKVSPVFPNYP